MPFYTMPAMKISLGLSSRLVQIVKRCKPCHGVNDIVISSILVKKNPTLNALIRRVDDMLRDLCVINGFGFICNDMITAKCLWKDGIHLQDVDTSILSKKIYLIGK